MKITVLTPSLRSAATLPECLDSVAAQTHPGVEHIVIDGGSDDGTAGILEGRTGIRWISEPDRGLYDALNKGLAIAGGDLVGVLGADDVYAGPEVLARVARTVEATGADTCYGDLEYVRRHDPARVVRRWRSGPYRPGAFRWGWMPPHPTFFVRHAVYRRHGGFREDFRVAADYELMLRLLDRHHVTTSYLPEVLVRMRLGGMSNRSLAHLIRKSREDLRAWRVNGLRGGIVVIALKHLVKVPQFLPPLLRR